MKVNSKLLEAYYANKSVSASSVRAYHECPKKFEYRYIQKLPELEHDYFDTGKRVEEELYRMLGADMEGYDIEPTEDQKEMAKALYAFKPFRELIDGKAMTFQREYYSGNLKGLTDLETEECVIDIKTSSSDWTNETVRESRWQAKIYTRLTGKPFYFCIVNKKTKKCQLIKVPIKDFDDLDQTMEEMKLATELGVFQPIPSFKCRFCDFRKACDSDKSGQVVK